MSIKIKEYLKKHLITRKNIQLTIFTIIMEIIMCIPVIVMLIVYNPQEPPYQPHNPTEDYFSVLHISDLHFSTTSDGSERKNLEDFCEMLPQIHPDVVVVTGDLTNQRNGSQVPVKNREEFIMYNETVTKCLELYQTRWYDMRGNHDADGSYGYNDTRNYINEILRGNTKDQRVNYIDVSKGNSVMRIISADVYAEAYLAKEGEGYMTTQDVDKMVEYVNENNTYNIIAAHKFGNRIRTDNRKALSDELAKRIKNIDSLTAYISGHLHQHEMTTYINGYHSSKVQPLRWRYFKQMIMKNHRMYGEQYLLGEIPIVPICPGDYTKDCQYTEVYVGYIVEKVKLITENGTTIELFTEDNHLWKSDQIVSDEKIKIEVVMNGTSITQSYELGKKYRSYHNIELTVRMDIMVVVISMLLLFNLLIRIIFGFIQRKFKKFEKIELFALYSNMKTYEFVIVLMLLIVFFGAPLLIGYNGFEHDGKQVLFAAGTFGAYIGDYQSLFYTYGFGNYLAFVVATWLCCWGICHHRQGHHIRGVIGMILMLCILIGYNGIFVGYYFSPMTFLFSPFTYLIILYIVYSIIDYIRQCNLLKQKKQASYDSLISNESEFY